MTQLATTSSSLEAQMTYAKALAASDLLPNAYRGKPANVLVALALGEALGISPTTALYGINVIQGKPTLSAETMRAIVLAHGHRFDVTAFTETEARVECARAERPGDVSTFTFTIEDAKRAGLVGGNYDKFPKAMLLARVTSAACRAVFPDVLAGVSYTPDELDADDVPQLAETARPRAAAYRPQPGRDYTPEGSRDGSPIPGERVEWTVADEDLVEAELVEHTPEDVDAALDRLEAAGIITTAPPLVDPKPEPPLTGPAGRARAVQLAGPPTTAQLAKLRQLMTEQRITVQTLDSFASERLGFTIPEHNVEQLTRGQASQLISSMTGGK